MRVLAAFVRNLLVLVWFPLVFLGRRFSRPRASWIRVPLEPHLRELPAPGSPLSRFLKAQSVKNDVGLAELDKLLTRVERDPRISGVQLELPKLKASWGRCCSLRDKVRALRTLGKKVVVFLPTGGGNLELFVASAADVIVTTPEATLALRGLGLEGMYFGSFLRNHGVDVELYSCGAYKAAAEPLVRDAMSEAQREQLSRLLEGRYAALQAALKKERPLSVPLETLFEQGLLTAERAQQARLVDQLHFSDELEEKVRGNKKCILLSKYVAWHQWQWWKPLRAPKQLGVISLKGVIEEERASFPPMRESATLGEVRRVLTRARKSSRIRGVILHIESPGGSAEVSELLHREVLRLAQKKPVIAYFDTVAASGGYYIAMAATAQVAQPLCVTGSIGVFALKPVVRRVLAEHGVHFDSVETAESAHLFSLLRPTADQQRDVLRQHVRQTYRTFIRRVAEGRRMSDEDVLERAEGRIYLGQDAFDRGLVDRVGSLRDAVEMLKARMPADATKRNLPLTVLNKKRSLLSALRGQQLQSDGPGDAWQSLMEQSLTEQSLTGQPLCCALEVVCLTGDT